MFVLSYANKILQKTVNGAHINDPAIGAIKK